MFRTGFVENDGMFVYQDTAYFIGSIDGILYSLNMADNSIQAIGAVPVKGNVFRACCTVVVGENMIYCLPAKADSVYFYNCLKREWGSLLLGPKNMSMYIKNAWVQKKLLWIVAPVLAEVIALDMQTGTIVFREKLFSGHRSLACGLNALLYNQAIYIPACNTGAIVRVSTEDFSIRLYKLPPAVSGINVIARVGERCFIAGCTGKLFELEAAWDSTEAEIIKIKNEYDIVTGDRGFKDVACVGTKLVFIYTYVSHITHRELAVFDVEAKQFLLFEVEGEFAEPIPNGGGFVFEYVDDNGLIYFTRDFEQKAFSLNMENFEIRKNEYSIETVGLTKVMADYVAARSIQENRIMQIDDYLQFLVSKDRNIIAARARNNVGADIYNHLVDEEW